MKVSLTLKDIICGECRSGSYEKVILDNKVYIRCRDCGHKSEKVMTYTAHDALFARTQTAYACIARIF